MKPPYALGFPPQSIQPTGENKSLQRPLTKSTQDFKTIFQDTIHQQRTLTISKHANERLAQRGIHIPDQQWQKITEKVLEAKKLGVNESLVLTKHAALIVSAKNQTVITAMDRTEAKTQIFTNINGTIIVDD
jgi:flagellar operon protein